MRSYKNIQWGIKRIAGEHKETWPIVRENFEMETFFAFVVDDLI